MYNIIVKEQVNILDKQIPVLLGGFGENEIVLSDKNIANVHNMLPKNIRSSVNRNIARFNEGIDIIDLQKVAYEISNNFSLDDMGYTKMEQSKSKNLYIFSRRGYLKLIKIMNTDKAWEVYEEMLDKYFTMEKQLKETPYQNNITERLFNLENAINTLLEHNKTLYSLLIKNTIIENTNQQIISEITEQDASQWREKQYENINRKIDELHSKKVEKVSYYLKRIYNNMQNEYRVNWEEEFENYISTNYPEEKPSYIEVVSHNYRLRDLFEQSIQDIYDYIMKIKNAISLRYAAKRLEKEKLLADTQSSKKELSENKSEEILIENEVLSNPFTKYKTFDKWKDVISRVFAIEFSNKHSLYSPYDSDLQLFLRDIIHGFPEWFGWYDMTYTVTQSFRFIFCNKDLKELFEEYVIYLWNKQLKSLSKKTIYEIIDVVLSSKPSHNVKFGNEYIEF